MDMTAAALGRAIKRCRRHAGDMSQTDLAAKLGVSKSTLNRWENGDIQTISQWAVAVVVAEATSAPRQWLGLSPVPDGVEDPALIQPQVDRLRSDVARLGQLVTELNAELERRTAKAQPLSPPASDGQK